MKRFSPNSKTFKIFTALYQGRTLTAARADREFGVKNISAEVSRIKQNGYAVYSNTRQTGTGVKVTEYVMGSPSREIVALGYRARSLGITL